MQIIKQRIPKKTKIQIGLISAAIILICAYIVWDVLCHGPITDIIYNRDQIVAAIESAGFLAPALFILIQATQTIVAPIPGGVTGLIGGFIFGWWGILWSLIGVSIGCYVVLWLTRQYGRPFVEKIFKKEALDKFDFITGKHARFILLMIFLLPAMPDDMACYLAGLTTIPIRELLVIAIIGRIPAVAANTYIGFGLGEQDLVPVIIFSLLSVFVILLIIVFRERIIRYFRHKSGKISDKISTKISHKTSDSSTSEPTKPAA